MKTYLYSKSTMLYNWSYSIENMLVAIIPYI